MDGVDDIISQVARLRLSGASPAQVVAPLLDPGLALQLSGAQRLSVWKKAWWYGRDPRIALELRESGHWNDADVAWRALEGTREVHLLSPHLMELSTPSSRNVPLSTWHERAMSEVSNMGVDGSTRFLWAAVYALPEGPDRIRRAMDVPWVTSVERRATEIVVNKWVLSQLDHLSDAMEIWGAWLSAADTRLAAFGEVLPYRLEYEESRVFGDEEKQRIARQGAGMRRFLLDAQAASCTRSEVVRRPVL